jgi:small ligand-binding sensory domain FIST
MTEPRFACGLSTLPDSAAAIAEVTGALAGTFGGSASPDLIVVFATHHHGSALEDLGARLRSALGAGVVIGCTGESVIGDSREIESSHGLVVWAAELPGTQVRPFELTARMGPDGTPLFRGGPEIEDPSRACVLLLADPFTFPADAFLGMVDETWPGVPVFGGMASGGTAQGQNLLITASGLRDSGGLGVVVEGDIEIRSVVSQGCRPVGKPWVITACEQNLVKKLGSKSALAAFIETLENVSEPERALLRRQPFMGLAIDAAKSSFERGDFLVRGILGQGPDGSLAVGDLVRRGQTVQFLVRDASSAGEDLGALLASQAGGRLADGAPPHSAGALLFTCNGRGSRMFEEPNHDISRVQAALAPDVPVAGFFAAGEIGPVGGRNFLHGFTASVAVFRPRG